MAAGIKLARKPARHSGSRTAKRPSADPIDIAPRSGPSLVLVVSFLLLVALGGLIVWLQFGASDDTGAKVSLTLQPSAQGGVEELIGGQKPKTPAAQQAAPASPAIRRTLPASLSPEGKLSLAPVPDPLLVEQTVIGPLPRIAEDGAQSWHVYAHPVPPADGRPRVAVVISSMGLRKAPTQLALERLPPAISLAFTPYSEGLQNWVAQARSHGHEVLLELPMEPYDYPENDPGPQALLTSLSAEENTNRLEWLLSRFSGYVGVINYFGAKFSTSETALGPVMAEMKGRGLMIVDNQSASRSRIADIAKQISMPFAAAQIQLDGDLNAASIDAKLAELEQAALAQGSASGMASPLPLTVERITIWAAQLKAKGIDLVPVSALIADNQK